MMVCSIAVPSVIHGFPCDGVFHGKTDLMMRPERDGDYNEEHM